jgi:hypothetical protein
MRRWSGEYETERAVIQHRTGGAPIDKIVKIDSGYWSDSVLAGLVLNR